MRFLTSCGTALVGAVVVVLFVMLLSHLLNLRLQWWVAVCIAVSCALGIGIKAQLQLPRGGSALLMGVLAGTGYVVGTLLSAHA